MMNWAGIFSRIRRAGRIRVGSMNFTSLRRLPGSRPMVFRPGTRFMHRKKLALSDSGAKNLLKRLVIHAEMSQGFSWADTCKETNVTKKLDSFPLHRVASGSEELEGIPGMKSSQLARKAGAISVG